VNARKKQILVLFLISSLLFIPCFMLGCTKYTVHSDPVLFLIDGYVIDSNSQLLIDSVYIVLIYDDNRSSYCLTDSTGYFLFSPFGYFKNQFDLLLRFEKEGYITQDTTIQIKKQGEIIDSLMIYLSSE